MAVRTASPRSNRSTGPSSSENTSKTRRRAARAAGPIARHLTALAVVGAAAFLGVMSATPASASPAPRRRPSTAPKTVARTNIGTVHAVPGTENLSAVTCTSGSACLAVGASPDPSGPSNRGAVVPISNAGPGAVQVAPGNMSLAGVACTTATACQAVGQSNPAHFPPPQDFVFQGEVVPITGVTPAAGITVPGTGFFRGVACPTADSCEAVGVDGIGHAVVVLIVNGIPGPVKVVPGVSELFGVACPSATTCEAVGYASFSNNAVVVPITNGTPGPVRSVAPVTPNGSLYFRAVACPTAATCQVVGVDSAGDGVAVTVTNGVPGAVQLIAATTPGGNLDLNGVACPTSTICEAVGNDASDSTGISQGAVVPIIGGTPGSVEVVSGIVGLAGVACPSAAICEAAGNTDVMGVVVDIDVASTISTFIVAVSGSQAFGSSSPSFTTTTTPPTGDTFSGTLTCSTVGSPATTISPTLPPGTYTLNGADCTGLTLNGPTASDYQVVYSNGTFTVNQAPISCVVTGLLAGPPKQQQVTVQTAGGLASIDSIQIVNGTVNVAPFTVGTTGPVVVTATKTDPSRATTWQFVANDRFGNSKLCA